MDIDRPGVAVIVGTPDEAEQALTVEHRALVLGERREQLELLGAELELLTVQRHLAAGAVDAEAVDLDDVRDLPLPLATAEDGFHSRHELARIEGLGHVVVGADLEADDAVDVVTAGGEDDHRHVAGLADLLADGQAVHLRHHYVEDDEVRAHRLRPLERLLAVRRGLDPEALVVQVETGELDDVLLVIDDEDGSGHGSSVSAYVRMPKV